MGSSALAKNPKLEAYLDAFGRKVACQTQAQDLDMQAKLFGDLVQANELRGMRRVLKSLEFIDQQDVVQLKGRMACEISSGGHEVLLTEMVFQNVFSDLSATDGIALCSCLVCDEKTNETFAGSQVLRDGFDAMQNIAKDVGAAMHDSGVLADVEEYVGQLKPHMMEVVIAWMNGKSFLEVTSQSSLFEGSIVRMMRRLDDLVRELSKAAKIIGNDPLSKKMSEGREKLRRGIIFSPSLYI